jgi:hypothetical protein
MYFSFIYLTEIRSIIWLTWIALFGTDTLWMGGWESKPCWHIFSWLALPCLALNLGLWNTIYSDHYDLALILLGSLCLALTHFGWVGGNLGLLELPFLVIPVILCLPVFFSLFSGIYRHGFPDTTRSLFTCIVSTVLTSVCDLCGISPLMGIGLERNVRLDDTEKALRPRQGDTETEYTWTQRENPDL